jgi:bacterioferritin-associated ferredoxin
MYVCLCKGVTERSIRETIANGAETVEEIMLATSAGTRCGTCVPTIAALAEASLERSEADARDAPTPSRRQLKIVQPASAA